MPLGFPPYQPFEGVRGSLILAQSIAEETPDTLAEVVRQVVQAESPVHLDQVYERVRTVCADRVQMLDISPSPRYS